MQGMRSLEHGGVGDRDKRRGIEDHDEAAGGDGRAEMEGRLIRRSLQDESFRQRLLEDPRAAVEEELGTRLPEDLQVRAVEETADTIYLVLPNESCDFVDSLLGFVHQPGHLQEAVDHAAVATVLCRHAR